MTANGERRTDWELDMKSLKQENEVVDFVERWNAEHGKGGYEEASREFGMDALEVNRLVKRVQKRRERARNRQGGGVAPKAVEKRKGEDDPRMIVVFRPHDVIPSPLQPRKRFDPVKLRELAESVYHDGVAQPITGRRRADGPVEIVCGERRWRATCLCEEGMGAEFPAKEMELPVVIRELDDETVLRIQMIENLQRDDLTPVEEALGYERMAGFGASEREISRTLGVPKTRVHRCLRLLELPQEWLEKVDAGEVKLYVAEAGLKVPVEMCENAESGPGTARMAALEAAAKAGSQAEAERLIRNRYLKPAEDRKRWAGMEGAIRKEHGIDIEILDFAVCRELFEQDSTFLRAGADSPWRLAEAVPKGKELAPGKVPGETWGELAGKFGAPLYAACDGEMVVRLLVNRHLVIDAARVAHAEDMAMCPFPAVESKDKQAQQSQAKHAERDEETEAAERAETARAMLLAIEGMVRPGSGLLTPTKKVEDRNEFERECAAFLISAGMLGLGGEQYPAMHVLMALDRVEPDSQKSVFARWPGFEREWGGFASLCVCSWALYWFDLWEGDSLEDSEAWKRLVELYGVSLPEHQPVEAVEEG